MSHVLVPPGDTFPGVQALQEPVLPRENFPPAQLMQEVEPVLGPLLEYWPPGHVLQLLGHPPEQNWPTGHPLQSPPLRLY